MVHRVFNDAELGVIYNQIQWSPHNLFVDMLQGLHDMCWLMGGTGGGGVGGRGCGGEQGRIKQVRIPLAQLNS